jgi:hypothetical protein
VVAADPARRDEVAGARSAKSPAASREEGSPRLASLGASTAPRTPSTAPPVDVSASTRWRKRKVSRPARSCSRARRTNGSSTPGPVPQVTWKRGTEFPCPVAR